MTHFLTLLQENNLLSTVVRLLLAAVLGGLIGTERGAKGRAAGMRTHIIVCIGAAMTALVGLYTTDVLGQSSDPMRLSAQVISGIGFLGGGMILIRGRHRITGLTTAAGLWTTAWRRGWGFTPEPLPPRPCCCLPIFSCPILSGRRVSPGM